MSYFAKINSDNKVIDVLNADLTFIQHISKEGDKYIECDKFTRANKKVDPETLLPTVGIPLRGNFPGKGYTYDPVYDVFYAPKEFESWTLNTESFTWEPPIPMPESTAVAYTWLEEEQKWVTFEEYWEYKDQLDT